MPTEIQIPSAVITGLQLILAFVGAFSIALWISLIIWTFRDARLRSRDMFAIMLATLMVTIFGPLGVVLYFLLRPPTTLAELYERSLEEEALLQDLEEKPLCPGCSRQVAEAWIVCPDCHTSLKKNCTHCGKSLNLNWNICPFCGVHTQDSGMGDHHYDHGQAEVVSAPTVATGPVMAMPAPTPTLAEPAPEPEPEPEPIETPIPEPVADAPTVKPAPPADSSGSTPKADTKPTYLGNDTRPHVPETGSA